MLEWLKRWLRVASSDTAASVASVCALNQELAALRYRTEALAHQVVDAHMRITSLVGDMALPDAATPGHAIEVANAAFEAVETLRAKVDGLAARVPLVTASDEIVAKGTEQSEPIVVCVTHMATPHPEQYGRLHRLAIDLSNKRWYAVEWADGDGLARAAGVLRHLADGLDRERV